MRLFKNKSIRKVESFAVDAHKGQKRKYSDKAYITHPIEVALRVEDRFNNNVMIAAALLHDVLEDTKVTHSELRAVSYTHLRAHETGRNLVCRLLLEKKKR